MWGKYRNQINSIFIWSMTILFLLGCIVIISEIKSGQFYNIITVKIRAIVPHTDTYQLFFDRGKGFNEKDSIHTTVGPSKNYKDIVFKLPSSVRKINNIRLDLGNINRAWIIIKCISLENRQQKIIWDAEGIGKQFLYQHEVTLSDVGGAVQVETLGNDPYVYGNSIGKAATAFMGVREQNPMEWLVIICPVLIGLRFAIIKCMMRNPLSLLALIAAIGVQPGERYQPSELLKYHYNANKFKKFYENIHMNRYFVIFPCWLIIIGCSIFIMCFVYFVFSKSNWILGDDYILFSTILSGKPWPMINNTLSMGRFFPLYLFEFRPFKYIGNEPYLFYVWAALKAITTGACLFFTLRILTPYPSSSSQKESFAILSLKNSILIIFVSLFFLAEKMYYTFAEIIIPEQSLIPLMALFLLSYLLYLRDDKSIFTVIALASASFACYLKEPVFLIFLTIALNSILFDKKLPRRRLLFYYLLLLNSLLFIVLYFVFVFKHIGVPYNEGRAMGLGYLDISRNIFMEHPILAVGLGVFVARLFSIFRIKSLSISDSLLLSSYAYVFAFIVLRLNESYYFTPVYVFILPALYNLILTNLVAESKFKRTIGGIIALLIIFSYMGTGKRLVNEIQQIRYKRIHDIKYVESLWGRKLYFMTKHETDPGKTFVNNVDDWAHYVLQSFVDYSSNGKYTGTTTIQRLKDINEINDIDSDMVVVIPSRLRGEIQIANSLMLIRSNGYYDSYTLAKHRK
jgi:hypothetical protein